MTGRSRYSRRVAVRRQPAESQLEHRERLGQSRSGERLLRLEGRDARREQARGDDLLDLRLRPRRLGRVGGGGQERSAERSGECGEDAHGASIGSPCFGLESMSAWPCCRSRSRTTSPARPSAFASSASTPPTSGTREGCTASSADARCGSRRRRAASTSSRSTRPIAAEVGTLLGLPFDLAGFAEWAQGDPVLARAHDRARRLPAAALAGPLRGARDDDHGAAGLAAVGVRDPQPLRRALRRAGGARDRVPGAGARRRGERGRALRARVLAPQGRVRARARALRTRPGRRSPGSRTTEIAARLVAIRGLGEWSADWYLARHLGRPHAWPAGDLALRKAVRFFYPHVEDVRAFGASLHPFQNLSAHYLLVGHPHSAPDDRSPRHRRRPRRAAAVVGALAVREPRGAAVGGDELGRERAGAPARARRECALPGRGGR